MTLKDIANECGVSMMTVSNVISGNHKKVSKATIEKVNNVIRKYDFVPNQMASTLSSKSSKLVLVVIPYVKTSELATIYNQYLMSLLSSIERELMENGYYAILRSVFEAKDIEIMFKTWKVAGAIFLLPFFDEIIPKIEGYEKKNFVLIDSYAGIKGVSCSRCNDSQGCYLAADYLLKNGHKKIIFASEHKDNLLLEQRFDGFKKAVLDNSLEFSSDMVREIIPNFENGLAFGRTLTKENLDFTGIVCTSDLCALGIIQGAKENGLNVPEDFSIIGFDNIDVGNFSSPTLTSIDQQTSKKGIEAVHLLIKRINGQEKDELVCTETCLVVRDSVKKIEK